MKIVHASWERRNLGMDSWEVTLDRRDMNDVSSVLASLEDARFANAYVCVKLPVGNLRMVHALEDAGFRFCEVQFSLIDSLEPSPVMRYAETGMDSWKWEEIPKEREAWERVIAKITPGTFTTDRIALDPAFGPECSCRRYQNWIRDLFENPDAHLSVVRLGGQEVAFSLSITDPKSGRTHGVLGGTFEAYQGSGLGVFLAADPARKTDCARSRTAVSSNNPAVLQVHQSAGRTIYREMYVFRRLKQ